MAKILIRRNIPFDSEHEVIGLLKQMRSLAVIQPGYIHGETLKRVGMPGEILVISTWQSVEDWNNWMNNPQRLEIQEKIDFLLGEKTQYEIYEY
jgi:heme-degrading monooxygenase HmoA